MALPESIDIARAAVLAIDLHRGYLDPSVSNRPIPEHKARTVLDANERLFALARSVGMPVIHAVLSPDNLRGQRDERFQNPFFRWKASQGSVRLPMIDVQRLPAARGGGDIHPRLAPQPGEVLIDSKSSMSCFYGTELERAIRILGVDSLIIGGINTNTCVQCAAFDCFNRHLQAIVVQECVTTDYGDDLHEPALENIRRCLGWVATLDEVQAALVAASPDPTHEHLGPADRSGKSVAGRSRLRVIR